MVDTIYLETVYERPRDRHSQPKPVGFTPLGAVGHLLAVLLRWAKGGAGALIAGRQRQAEHDIARWLHLQGGTITDSMEREIERRWLRP